MTGYGVRKAAQECGVQVLNAVPDVQNRPLSSPAKPRKRDIMSLTVAALDEKRATRRKPHLNGECRSRISGLPDRKRAAISAVRIFLPVPLFAVVTAHHQRRSAFPCAALIAPTGEKYTARQHDERRFSGARQPVNNTV